MRSIVQYVNKLVIPQLPEPMCYGYKRWLLRLAGAKIGNNVLICSSVMVIGAGELEIGDDTWVGHRVLLSASAGIRIGRCVDIAPNVYIGTGTHGITPLGERIGGEEISADIVIGDGCWLCANSIVLPGVTLGEKCVLAAGAVATKSPGGAKRLLAGVPATVKKEL